LTKFLKCVTWTDPVESKQAVEKLLPLWGQEVGVDDALELLGPGFTDKRVRAFAVKRLERADDDVSSVLIIRLMGRSFCYTSSSLFRLYGSKTVSNRVKSVKSKRKIAVYPNS